MGLETIGLGLAGVASSLISSDAAGDAADTQVASTDRAIASQERMFNLINNQSAPQRRTSEQSLGMLLSGLQKGGELDTTAFNFSEDPGFQFTMNKGMTALNAGAASKGGARSGGNSKALAGYATGLASTSYNDAFNRFQTERTNRANQLLTLSGLGTSANNTTAAAGSSASQNIGTAAIAGGQAAASGQIGQANAVTGGMSNLASLYMQNKYMKSIFG